MNAERVIFYKVAHPWEDKILRHGKYERGPRSGREKVGNRSAAGRKRDTFLERNAIKLQARDIVHLHLADGTRLPTGPDLPFSSLPECPGLPLLRNKP